MMDASGRRTDPSTGARAWEIGRFLLGGLLNTAFSYAIYLVLLQVVSPVSAYSSAFLAGVFSGYAINTWLVFRTRWSWLRLAAFPLVHVVNYLCGTAVLWLAIHRLGVDERIAPLISICVTLPLNFVISRKIVKG